MYVGFSNESAVKDQIEIVLSGNMILKGKIEYEKANNHGDGNVTVLYRVTNLHELLTNDKLRPLLTEWIKDYRDYYMEMESKRKQKEKSNEDELDEMEYIWGGTENA